MENFKPSDIRIDKIWKGSGKGNIIRITHLPSGDSVEKYVPVDYSIYKASKGLKEKLSDKVAVGKKEPNLKMKSFIVDDDLNYQNERAIEIIITFNNGQKRWCYFFNPEALKKCGHRIDGTETIFHNGPHMIIIADKLTEELISKTLRHIEKHGDLLNCTLPI